jgi:hypothetical protein
MFKLIYPDGTIVKQAQRVPDNFTGTVEYNNGNKEYFVDRNLHMDGGLPAREWANGGKSYWVSNKFTGRFYP